MDEEPKFKFDLQGIIRTAITLGVVIGGYYQVISTINDKVAENRREISVLRADIEQHKRSTKVYTMDELTDRFVLRREWESNHKLLRDEMRYIRDKMDAIYNLVSAKGGAK